MYLIRMKCEQHLFHIIVCLSHRVNETFQKTEKTLEDDKYSRDRHTIGMNTDIKAIVNYGINLGDSCNVHTNYQVHQLVITNC